MAAFLVTDQRYEYRKIENRTRFFGYFFHVFEWMSEKESSTSTTEFNSL